MMKVKGHSGIAKKNATVVNIERNAYEKAKARKAEKDKVNRLEEKIDRLEKLIERLIDGSRT